MGSRTLGVYIGLPLSRESTTLCLRMPKPISEKRLMPALESHEYEAEYVQGVWFREV